jgi:hypothetical protein
MLALFAQVSFRVIFVLVVSFPLICSCSGGKECSHIYYSELLEYDTRVEVQEYGVL